MNRIAVFASGNGTNAENIIRYFNHGEGASDARVVLVVCNRKEAGVIARADRLGVPVQVLGRNDFDRPEVLGELLDRYAIDFIILAGFLLLVPAWLVERYPRRIINIHPALLPKYGGKGMYGENVHRAVVAAGESETGITIHYVNERFDEGEVIFRATTPLTPTDTVETVEDKIHILEQKHFPTVIHQVIKEAGAGCKAGF